MLVMEIHFTPALGPPPKPQPNVIPLTPSGPHAR